LNLKVENSFNTNLKLNVNLPSMSAGLMAAGSIVLSLCVHS